MLLDLGRPVLCWSLASAVIFCVTCRVCVQTTMHPDPGHCGPQRTRGRSGLPLRSVMSEDPLHPIAKSCCVAVGGAVMADGGRLARWCGIALVAAGALMVVATLLHPSRE